MEDIDLGFELPLFVDEDEFDESIEDDIPPVPVEPVVKYGDIFKLGDHVIMCGDTTSKEDITTLMFTEAINTKAAMIRTDPPYNVDYKGHGENTKNGIKNDKMGKDAFYQFLLDSFTTMNEVKQAK